MEIEEAAAQVLDSYPRIWFACHTRHVADPVTGTGLTSHLASVLNHLSADRATLVGDLARHLGVTPGTISVQLSKLEALGYVARVADANDRRRQGIILTPAGLRIRRANSPLDWGRLTGALSLLSPAERQQVADGLALLAKAAGEVGPG